MTEAPSMLSRALRAAGRPARMALIGLIRLYRVTLSGMLGGQCRFEPTCSHYGEQAVRSHGAIRGTWLAARRVFRCQPFGKAGSDPVPPSRWDRAQTYDTITLPAEVTP